MIDGDTFNPQLDAKRLATAQGRVYSLMRDGEWRTLRRIADLCECSEAGASARLRDFRKDKVAEVFGAFNVERKRMASGGTWLYRLVAKPTTSEQGFLFGDQSPPRDYFHA